MDDSLYAVLKVQYIFNMAQWLSWLERRPVTAEVESSSLFWVVLKEKRKLLFWDLSSAGRASALQAEGHRFEPCRPHWMYYLSKNVYNINMGEFPSGQRGQTVNLLALPSVVRIHLRPLKCRLTNCHQAFILNMLARGGAVWKLVGLITRRS